MKKYCKRILITVAILFFSCISSQADVIDKMLVRAKEAYGQKDYYTSINLYESVLKQNPKLAEAYNGLGLAHKEIGTDEAEVTWYFKTAVDLDANYAEAQDNLGKAYYGLGHFERAEKHCLKALELKPTLVSAKFSLGWIYLLGKSDPEKAIPYFKEVLGIQQIPYAQFGLGLSYFMKGDRAYALDSITTLRSMGENTLATQLENIIRGRRYVPEAYGRALVNVKPSPVSVKKPSMIVGPGFDQEKKEEPVEEQSSFGGTRLRLRGTVFPITEGKKEGKETQEDKDDKKTNIRFTPTNKSE